MFAIFGCDPHSRSSRNWRCVCCWDDLWTLNLSDQEAVNFAAAACALKHTVEGDANVVSVGDVVSLVKGNTSGSIKR